MGGTFSRLFFQFLSSVLFLVCVCVSWKIPFNPARNFQGDGSEHSTKSRPSQSSSAGQDAAGEPPGSQFSVAQSSLTWKEVSGNVLHKNLLRGRQEENDWEALV